MATLGKIDDTKKTGHTWKNGSHLKKRLTFVKMSHTLIGKMGQTWRKRGQISKKNNTSKKLVTLKKLGDIREKGSHS